MHLELKNLHIGYHQSLLQSPINLHISAPQLCIVFGNNGCGKTTLIKTLARLISPLNGSICLDKQPVFDMSPSMFAKNFSFLFTTHPFLMNHTVEDIIALGRMPYLSWNARLSDKDRQIIERYAELLNIHSLLHKSAHEISDGQFQKALIAKTLAQQTPIIIMDEPLSHLDYGTKTSILRTMQNIVRSENKLIILSSHDIHLCKQYADNILLIHQKQWLFSIHAKNKFGKNYSLIFFKQIKISKAQLNHGTHRQKIATAGGRKRSLYHQIHQKRQQNNRIQGRKSLIGKNTANASKKIKTATWHSSAEKSALTLTTLRNTKPAMPTMQKESSKVKNSRTMQNIRS
ncbi:MAG: hypothetical protein KatS3mg028_0645 [Bacteroidia bacterium]|nr:MAG: hypothetical protein KatS3mg028_0645 [Bacteroidia bacterium]